MSFIEFRILGIMHGTQAPDPSGAFLCRYQVRNLGQNPLAQTGVFVVKRNMTITLHPEQEAWLQTRVASGDFASVEAAARQLLDERIAELEFDQDDIAWAKPYVDKARDAVERGEFATLDEHRTHKAAVLASLEA